MWRWIFERGSPTLRTICFAAELSDENNLQMYIPRGFAHGFAVLSEVAHVAYKTDAYYAPESEGARSMPQTRNLPLTGNTERLRLPAVQQGQSRLFLGRNIARRLPFTTKELGDDFDHGVPRSNWDKELHRALSKTRHRMPCSFSSGIGHL